MIVARYLETTTLIFFDLLYQFVVHVVAESASTQESRRDSLGQVVVAFEAAFANFDCLDITVSRLRTALVEHAVEVSSFVECKGGGA